MKEEIMLANRKNWISIMSSLTVHAGFMSVFFMLSAFPLLDVQTFHIRFDQFQEEQSIASSPAPVQAATTHREIRRPRTQKPPMQPTQRNTDVIAPQQPDNVPPVLAQESQLPPASTNVMSAASAASAAPTGDKTTNSGVLDTKFGEVDAPRFLHRELPLYPHRARRLGREGKVVLKLFIDQAGKLRDVAVVEPAAYGFTEAAVEAVKKSTFAPARRHGQSVASRAIINIRFHLLSE
ncbi:MAG: TonB family protein [Smithellaceae bacterium]|jgi:TonB family protein